MPRPHPTLIATRLFGRVGLLLALLCTDAAAAPGRWLLVDSNAMTLVVMDGEQALLTLHDIAVGRYGTSATKHRGDNTTPLGQFRITHIKRDAAFHRFIGLDYPDADRARRGRQDGLVSEAELAAILAAHRRSDTPPQGTALGGHIGIHGIGKGDPALHAAVNWTKGCVALTNEQVDTLLRWVEIGMPVEIR